MDKCDSNFILESLRGGSLISISGKKKKDVRQFRSRQKQQQTSLQLDGFCGQRIAWRAKTHWSSFEDQVKHEWSTLRVSSTSQMIRFLAHFWRFCVHLVFYMAWYMRKLRKTLWLQFALESSLFTEPSVASNIGIRATRTSTHQTNAKHSEISILLNSPPQHLGKSHSSSSSWFATSLAASSWAAFSFAFFLSAFLWMICVDILSRWASSLIPFVDPTGSWDGRDWTRISNKNHQKLVGFSSKKCLMW